MRYSDTLTDLAEAIEEYDVQNFAASVGALQLIPENADCLIRLEVLSHVVASIVPSGALRTVKPRDLRGVCNAGVIGEGHPASMDDPCNELLTVEVPFYGGTYRAFPGTTEYAAENLTTIISAIFYPGSPFEKSAFSKTAYRLIRSALLVSEMVAARAGLPRAVEPVKVTPRCVTVPPTERLNELRSAVVFSTEELDGLLEEARVTRDDLAPLMRFPGGFSPQWGRQDNTPLCVSPILDYGREVVILVPGLLLPALCHAIILIAIAHEKRGELVSELSRATWNKTRRALDLLNCEPLTVHSVQTELPVSNLRDKFFALDRDRAMYVLQVTEDFQDYPDETPFDQWPSQHLNPLVASKIKQALQHHEIDFPWSQRLFILLLLQTPGRAVSLDADTELAGAGKDYDFLHLTVWDFSIFSMNEIGNGLALWKFARSLYRFQENTRVISFSQLDLYRIYQQHHHSFYLRDDRQLDLLSLDPGISGEVRRETYRRVDAHYALSLDRQTYHEVGLFRADRRLPIYAPPRPIRGHIALLVEDLPIPVWVSSQEEISDRVSSLRQMYVSLVEATAYVIWRLATEVSPILMQAQGRYPNLVVEILLPAHENWDFFSEDSDGQNGASLGATDPPISCLICPDWGAVQLTIHNTFIPLASTPFNDGERQIGACLLKALGSLLLRERPVPEANIQNAIERYLPRGPQKMVILPRTRSAFLLEDAGLPSYRATQEADVEMILDELGDHLHGERAIPLGQIPPDECEAFINTKVVAWLYRELCETVSKLSPDSLLVDLTGHHEAVLREQEFLKLTTPTRLACFGFDTGLEGEIHRQMYASDIAALASRFLIEYVAAQPPTGNDLLALATYDRLLALSRHIIYYGFASDLIHYKLGELRFAMLPSGRLGENREVIDRAWQAFSRRFGSGRVRNAGRAFTNYWNWNAADSTGDEQNNLADEDRVMTEEFGYSLTEILQFLHWLVEQAILSGSPPAMTMPLGELVNRFAASIGWNEIRVANLVELLSIRPRDKFLAVPDGYENYEAWPWRFNRRLSYLRRPVLIRSTANGEIAVWGMRHTYRAGDYLLTQLVEGRLPPIRGKHLTRPMKQYQSQANIERGKEFERQVIAALADVITLRVRGPIKRIKDEEVGEAGEIDAIAANLARAVIYVLECKDLSLAKTPYEMGKQIRQLHSTNPSEKTAVSQVLRKAEWVRTRVGLVLEHLNVPLGRRAWKVKPLVVTDELLLTASFVNQSVPIVAFDDLVSTVSR